MSHVNPRPGPVTHGRRVPSRFRPAWWLTNPHLQTLWPTFFRLRPRLSLARERVELPDGDFIDLAWTPPRDGPLVLVIHGLEGSLDSHYVAGTLSALLAAGFPAVFMHLRGCSGEPNRLPRRYHSGATEDLAAIIAHIQHSRGAPPAGAVGFSLGGNLLLKYLGEQGGPAPLRAAVAVSVPFRLLDCARRLERGLSRFYQAHLMARLRQAFLAKQERMTMPLPADLKVEELRDFYSFDERVTAPLHGFAGADDYYARCSSRQFLRHIQTPTLLLHARDDPFMYPGTLPEEAELGPEVILEVAEHGGHVGFVAGVLPGRAHYWLDQRIPGFLKETLIP